MVHAYSVRFIFDMGYPLYFTESLRPRSAPSFSRQKYIRGCALTKNSPRYFAYPSPIFTDGEKVQTLVSIFDPGHL